MGGKNIRHLQVFYNIFGKTTCLWKQKCVSIQRLHCRTWVCPVPRQNLESVTTVVSWLVPTSRKQLQRSGAFPTSTDISLGMSVGYMPLFMLSPSKVSATVLTLPDPHLQFVVKVDALAVGIGAIFSQHSIFNNKLHPCAFLSLKLSSSKRNYNVGN